MSLGLTREQFLRFIRLDPEEQRALIAGLSPMDALAFDADFEFWAAEGQLPPAGDGWRTWLMLAGRGFGKTRAGAEWIHRIASSRPTRIALVAATLDEARAVMVEGVSGILSVARRKRHKVKWEPSLGKISWQGGAVAQLFSGDNPDGLRGPEHHLASCDELAKWRQAEGAWDNLQMGLRAGARPRALVTTTPRSIRLIDRIMKDPRTGEDRRADEGQCVAAQGFRGCDDGQSWRDEAREAGAGWRADRGRRRVVVAARFDRAMQGPSRRAFDRLSPSSG